MKDNPCKGCRTSDSSPPYSYHKCIVYAQTITNISFEEFRDKYCPCVNCIVKVICPNSYKFYTPGKRCDLILQVRQEVTSRIHINGNKHHLPIGS